MIADSLTDVNSGRSHDLEIVEYSWNGMGGTIVGQCSCRWTFERRIGSMSGAQKLLWNGIQASQVAVQLYLVLPNGTSTRVVKV